MKLGTFHHCGVMHLICKYQIYIKEGKKIYYKNVRFFWANSVF